MINLFEIVINAFEMFVAIMFMTLYFDCKFSDWRKYAGFIGWVVLSSTWLTLLNTYITFEGVIGMVSFTLLYFSYALIFLKGDNITKLFVAGFLDNVIYVLAMIIVLLPGQFMGVNYLEFVYSTEINAFRVGVVTFKQIITAVLLLIPLHFRLNKIGRTKALAIIVAVTPMIVEIALDSFYRIYLTDSSTARNMLLASGVLILADVLIYAFCLNNDKYITQQTELNTLKIQRDSYITHTRDLENLYSKTYGIRHDMKNHLTALSALIEKEPQEAQEYVNSLMENSLGSMVGFIRTDNECFNAIANTKMAVSEQEGIKVQTRIMNKSLDRLGNDEIAVIFGNLFDNAIEAARNSKKKNIELDVRLQGSYLSIVMSNSIDTSVLEKNEKLHTTKADAQYHGFGTKNIKSIVDEHGGILNYFEENGMFGCQILI